MQRNQNKMPRKRNNQQQETVSLKPMETTVAVDNMVFESFNEIGNQVMTELNQRHNEYAALRKQEEDLRQQRRNLTSVIHDLKTESKFKISDIIIPFGKGYVHLRESNKNDIIRQHYDALTSLDTQLNAIVVQREHRGDEFGAAILRATRYLWEQLKIKYCYSDEELFSQVKPVDHSRPAAETPGLEKMLDSIPTG